MLLFPDVVSTLDVLLNGDVTCPLPSGDAACPFPNGEEVWPFPNGSFVFAVLDETFSNGSKLSPNISEESVEDGFACCSNICSNGFATLFKGEGDGESSNGDEIVCGATGCWSNGICDDALPLVVDPEDSNGSKVLVVSWYVLLGGGGRPGIAVTSPKRLKSSCLLVVGAGVDYDKKLKACIRKRNNNQP